MISLQFSKYSGMETVHLYIHMQLSIISHISFYTYVYKIHSSPSICPLFRQISGRFPYGKSGRSALCRNRLADHPEKFFLGHNGDSQLLCSLILG